MKQMLIIFKKQKRAYAVIWIFPIILALVIITTLAVIQKRSIVTLSVGEVAPVFELESIQGEIYAIKNLDGRNLLLTFLNTQVSASDANSVDNRGQVNLLKSMHTQYSSEDLEVIIIDSSILDTGKRSDPDKLLNFTYDWELGNIVVLSDLRNGDVAKSYGVTSLPTTFLIDWEGRINQRWDGLAISAQMALAIENLIGEPDYRAQQIKEKESNTLQETLAEAKFPGLIPARALSQDIWLVDGGGIRQEGEGYPIKWIVIGDYDEINISATATNLETWEEINLLEDEKMEKLPEDEARRLLTNLNEKTASVFLLDYQANMKSGIYEVNANAYPDPKLSKKSLKGEGIITVQ